MADSFPLYVPPKANRLHQSESLLRRFAQMARWGESSSLLELFGSSGSISLAQGIACRLTIVEPDVTALGELKSQVAKIKVGDKVVFRNEAVRPGAFGAEAFDGIFSFGRVLGTPAQVARAWRPHLAFNGRLGMTAVVKIGRHNNEPLLAKWKERLGSPVLSPRETLAAVEQEGFEPELIETPGEQELEEYYQSVEALLGDSGGPGVDGLKDEIAWHRSGQTGITLAFLVARRREPNEKPPLSRDGG